MPLYMYVVIIINFSKYVKILQCCHPTAAAFQQVRDTNELKIFFGFNAGISIHSKACPPSVFLGAVLLV